jgi:mono/diheme cytochrome c family protein
MYFLKLSVTIFTLGIFIFSCSQASNSPVTKANATNANQAAPVAAATPMDEMAMAQDMYKKNCMICHKETGKGGKVTVEGKELEPQDLTSDKFKKRDDDKLAKNIGDGSPDDGMPAFKKKLSDDQIRTIIKYVRVLQSK